MADLEALKQAAVDEQPRPGGFDKVARPGDDLCRAAERDLHYSSPSIARTAGQGPAATARPAAGPYAPM